MTTAVTTQVSKQLPAHIMARVQARGGQVSETMGAITSGGMAYPRISIKASRFRLVEDGVETPIGINADVIIIGANPRVSKQWYEGAYGSDEKKPPNCFSDDGVTPDASITAPVSPTCALCPKNVLGSGKLSPQGKKTKECSDYRHLAVVPAADPTKIYGLGVAVSGMKDLREYFKDLQNYGLIVEEVITTLGFDDNADYPKVTFRQKENGFVPEAMLPEVEKLTKDPNVMVVTRRVPQPAAKPALPAASQAAGAVQPAEAAQAAAVPEKVVEQPAAVVQLAAVQQVATAAAAVNPTPATAENTTPIAGVSALESKLAALFN